MAPTGKQVFPARAAMSRQPSLTGSSASSQKSTCRRGESASAAPAPPDLWVVGSPAPRSAERRTQQQRPRTCGTSRLRAGERRGGASCSESEAEQLIPSPARRTSAVCGAWVARPSSSPYIGAPGYPGRPERRGAKQGRGGAARRWSSSSYVSSSSAGDVAHGRSSEEPAGGRSEEEDRPAAPSPLDSEACLQISPELPLDITEPPLGQLVVTSPHTRESSPLSEYDRAVVSTISSNRGTVIPHLAVVQNKMVELVEAQHACAQQTWLGMQRLSAALSRLQEEPPRPPCPVPTPGPPPLLILEAAGCARRLADILSLLGASPQPPVPPPEPPVAPVAPRYSASELQLQRGRLRHVATPRRSEVSRGELMMALGEAISRRRVSVDPQEPASAPSSHWGSIDG